MPIYNPGDNMTDTVTTAGPDPGAAAQYAAGDWVLTESVAGPVAQRQQGVYTGHAGWVVNGSADAMPGAHWTYYGIVSPSAARNVPAPPGDGGHYTLTLYGLVVDEGGPFGSGTFTFQVGGAQAGAGGGGADPCGPMPARRRVCGG